MVKYLREDLRRQIFGIVMISDAPKDEDVDGLYIPGVNLAERGITPGDSLLNLVFTVWHDLR